VEEQDCRLAQTTGKLTIDGKEVPLPVGTSNSHYTFLVGDITDSADCTTSITETGKGKKLGGQAAQAVCKITITDEYAKINDLSGILTFNRGIAYKNGDLGLMDSMGGTYVLVHVVEACPKMLVQLYKEIIRIFSNHTASMGDGLVLMEDKVKGRWPDWS
jgi:hypothetical protein